MATTESRSRFHPDGGRRRAAYVRSAGDCAPRMAISSFGAPPIEAGLVEADGCHLCDDASTTPEEAAGEQPGCFSSPSGPAASGAVGRSAERGAEANECAAAIAAGVGCVRADRHAADGVDAVAAWCRAFEQVAQLWPPLVAALAHLARRRVAEDWPPARSARGRVRALEPIACPTLGELLPAGDCGFLIVCSRFGDLPERHETTRKRLSG